MTTKTAEDTEVAVDPACKVVDSDASLSSSSTDDTAERPADTDSLRRDLNRQNPGSSHAITGVGSQFPDQPGESETVRFPLVIDDFEVDGYHHTEIPSEATDSEDESS